MFSYYSRLDLVGFVWFNGPLKLSKLVGRPGTESLPSTIAPPDPLLTTRLWRLSVSFSLSVSVSLSLCPGDPIQRLFDKNQIKKSERKKREKGEKRRIVFSLFTEEIIELLYEHRCKVLAI